MFGKASRQLNGGEIHTRDASVGATSRQITFKATSLGEISQRVSGGRKAENFTDKISGSLPGTMIPKGVHGWPS